MKLLARIQTPSHSLQLSLFFFAGLEIGFAIQRLFFSLLFALVGIVIAGIVIIRYEEAHQFRPYQIILPAMAAISLAAFALFLPLNAWLHIYLAAAAICMYYVLRYGAKRAYPTWNLMISLIVLLIALGGILGSRYHLYIPISFTVTLTFVVTTLLMVQTMIRYYPIPAEAWLFASVLGIVSSQIIWVLQFLPLHFMVQAGIVLSVLYAAAGLLTAQAEKLMTKRLTAQYISLSAIALIALLLTARWQ